MANPFSKLWRYFMAKSNDVIDTHANPKIQIEQALTADINNHEALVKQASTIVGQARQNEMKTKRMATDAEQLETQVRQAVHLAEQAKQGGDAEKCAHYNEIAESLAAKLDAANAQLAEAMAMQPELDARAAEAKQLVKDSEKRVKSNKVEKDQILLQLANAQTAESQQASQRAIGQVGAPAPSGNTPTFDQVREKIERRHAAAVGAAELYGESAQEAALELEQASTQAASSAKLEEIRREMRGGGGSIAPGIRVVEPVYKEPDVIEGEVVPDSEISSNDMLSRLNGKPKE